MCDPAPPFANECVMIFDPTRLTGIHTDLSLVALAAGIIVVIGLLSARTLPGWTAVSHHRGGHERHRAIISVASEWLG